MKIVRPMSGIAALGMAFLWTLSPLAGQESEAMERHLENLAEIVELQSSATAQERFDDAARQTLHRHLARVEVSLKAGGDVEGAKRVAELRARWTGKGGSVTQPSPADRDALRSSRLQETQLVDGTLSGLVTQNLDGEPIENVSMFVSATDESNFFFGSTGADGRYEITLPEGNYRVSAFSTRYLEEIYDNIVCNPNCSLSDGDVVSVIGGENTDNIDFGLERKGIMRGRVTDSGGAALVAAGLTLYTTDGASFVTTAGTGPDGTFELSGIDPGSYLLLIEASGLQGELYNDVPCNIVEISEGNCELDQAQVLTVGANEILEGLDVSLEYLGSIYGRVTDQTTGEPLSFVDVVFSSVDSSNTSSTMTDIRGDYKSGGLLTGQYYVYTRNLDFYIDETYDNVVCELGFDQCNFSAGMPVTVELSNTTKDIDFALEPGGVVSGTVTSAVDGSAIQGLEVGIYRGLGDSIGFDFTDAAGRYSVMGLPTGTYRARTAGFDVENQVYDGLICPTPDTCPTDAGDPIGVQAQQNTPGIHFSLRRLGGMAGRVLAGTGEPLPNIGITIWDIGLTDFFFTHTDSNGAFEAQNLQPGHYVVLAEDPSGRYLAELYDDVPCFDGVCDLATGTPIEVRLDETTSGVDFALRLGGALSGIVTDRVTGLPLDFYEVGIFDAQGTQIRTAYTSQLGAYRVSGLPLGEYFVRAQGFSPHRRQIFDGIDCPLAGPCDPLTGTPVPVLDASQEVTGIDFQVETLECTGNDSREMCLQHGRFRVVVQWRNELGVSGYGLVNRFFNSDTESLSEDSGYFRFFGLNNIEGAIKVLDACTFGRFWVFAAGLTNVEVTTWVTDMATGQTRIYTNPQGQAYVPVQDTDAFDTCDASFTPSLASPVGEEIAPPASGIDPAASTKSCVEGSGIMCLEGGRFQVQAFFRTEGGEEQIAGTSRVTLDSGYLWFFDRQNVEVLVKVLDACSLSQRFWVFAAGLTNVEVRLVVTDTESGEIQEYRNDSGTVFQPILDTQAFATCF